MTLPVVEPSEDALEAVERGDSRDPVAGVLLVAGTSSRFGDRNKLLEPLDDTPIVARAAASLCASSVDSVTAVVGYDAEAVCEALADLPVEFVENPRYHEGQAASVQTGLEAVRKDCRAVVIALGDMPAVDPRSVNALLAAHRDGHGTTLAAAYEGERGNPVLFDASHFAELSGIEGDVGGRAFLRRDGVLVETGDPGVRRDVDEPDDLETVPDSSDEV